MADAPRYAFYGNWDDNSFVALKRHARDLNVLAPEWLHEHDIRAVVRRGWPGENTSPKDELCLNLGDGAK